MLQTDIRFSEEYREIGREVNRGLGVHLIVLKGELDFEYNHHAFKAVEGDIVVIHNTLNTGMMAASDELRVECLLAPMRWMRSLLPANNYGIGGTISLFQNPVIKTTQDEQQKFLDDIRRVRNRLNDAPTPFQEDILGALVLTMVLDLFDFHVRENGSREDTERPADITRRLLAMLESGTTMKHREVGYYARQLGVSPRYLGDVVKRTTGQSVVALINQYTVPLLVRMLGDPSLSLTQISDRMAFNSLSYFSRYVQKHLGQNPTDYRNASMPLAR